MSRVIGLDLGTNSIGWAIIDEKAKEDNIIARGVHVFSEGGDEKGAEFSLARIRTGFRSARKLKYRKRLRKQNLLSLLRINGMCPISEGELNGWKNNKKDYPTEPKFLAWLAAEPDKNPYLDRYQAANTRVSKEVLGRALYHICQRRGFLSNRIEQEGEGQGALLKDELLIAIKNGSDLEALLKLCKAFNDGASKDVNAVENYITKLLEDKENSDPIKTLGNYLNSKFSDGPVKTDIKAISQEMASEGCKTLGEYFYLCVERGEKVRKRFTAREEHYLAEFKHLMQTQDVDDGLALKLQKAIFYQRPLKSQKSLVGNCTFETNKPRCLVSHPMFERFRMLSYINSIKYKVDGVFRFLNNDEREKIKPLFFRAKGNFEFSEIAKNLVGKEFKNYTFNYKFYDKVSNAPTLAAIKRCFGDKADALPTVYENSGKQHKDVEHILWHALVDFDKKELLEAWLLKSFPSIDANKLKKLSAFSPKKEYGSLSLKALNKIVPQLERGHLYSHAVFLANMPEVVGAKTLDASDQQIIEQAIDSILDNDAEKRKMVSDFNAFIIQFAKNNTAVRGTYHLSEEDKEALKSAIDNTWGKTHYARKDENEKAQIWKELVRWAEKDINAYITPKPRKMERLDEQIILFLQDNFGAENIYPEKLYHPSALEPFAKAMPIEKGKYKGVYQLQSPRTPSLKNPVAMRTLFQVRRLVNHLLREQLINEETVVHVELARELNSANMRRAIGAYQKEREKSRDKAQAEIMRLYHEQTGKTIEPSETDILKYELWKEQNHRCLYTDKKIEIIEFIGNNPAYDIEHTIPRSLYPDNGMHNKTLAELKYNREVKGNKMPSQLANHEEILARLKPWFDKTKSLEEEISRRSKAKGLEDKDTKDKRITKRHKLKEELNYWRKKIDTFTRTDIPEGFKISQLVDTGIITRYAANFLKSYFNKVHSIKGQVVAEFRKIWGLQIKGDTKDRSMHAHHGVDALTIAAISKYRYDKLAHYFKDKDNGAKKPQLDEPWEGFAADVRQSVEDMLISSFTLQHTGKNTKKKLRKRGKIMFNEQNEVKYATGDTLRDLLHNESFYGAIKQNDEIKYVIRKERKNLKTSDVEKIVDPAIKNCIQEKIARGEIETKGGFLSLKPDQKIWFNKAKGIEIKKVRYHTVVRKPFKIRAISKAHQSKHEYKQHVYATNPNGGNYGAVVFMATVKGKRQKKMQVVNNFELYPYIKRSVGAKVNEALKIILEQQHTDVKILYTLRIGTKVIFYDQNIAELKAYEENEIAKRLYVVYKSGGAQVHFKHALLALSATEIKAFDESSNLRFGKSASQFKLNKIPVALYLTIGNFEIAVENVHFKMDIAGNIHWLN